MTLISTLYCKGSGYVLEPLMDKLILKRAMILVILVPWISLKRDSLTDRKKQN